MTEIVNYRHYSWRDYPERSHGTWELTLWHIISIGTFRLRVGTCVCIHAQDWQNRVEINRAGITEMNLVKAKMGKVHYFVHLLISGQYLVVCRPSVTSD